MITSLSPKYDELGAMYFNNPEYRNLVTVAKVDATANDVPEEIQGFPTIKLFPAGKDSPAPVDYNGSRSVEDLAKFIRDSGTHKVDVLHLATNASDESSDEVKDTAAAATDKVKEAVGSATEAIKETVGEATEAIKGAMPAGEDTVSDHDEL